MDDMDDLFGDGPKWTDEQKEIFEWFRVGKGNLVVRARAGAAKTTSLVEGVMRAPEAKILVAAFNKDIAKTLEGKLRNACASAKTLHALGFMLVKRYWPDTDVDDSGSRGERLVLRALHDLWPEELFGATSKPLSEQEIDVDRFVMNLATKILNSARDIVPFASTFEEVLEVIYELDFLPEPYQEAQGWTPQVLAKLTLRAMEFALERVKKIDFSDMVYLPLRNRWAKEVYDLVCIDEAQDMNKGQIELARRVCKRSGRMIVVGDNRQGIYGWRGADSESIDRLKVELEAKELPLTMTFRCPQLIVDYACTLVPDLRARPGAPPGLIENIDAEKLFELAKPGDFVLSRTNAPLMKAALSLIRKGVRAKVLGRDIGQRLAAIAKKLRAHDVQTFYVKLGDWARKECDRAKKVNRPGRIQLIHDQADTLRALLFNLTDLSQLYRRIEDLFGDREAAVVQLSTVHKAKGMEADRVFVLKDTLYAFKGKDKLEEQNIEYVAVTRAKQHLIWVTGFGPKKNKSAAPQPWDDPRWENPPWAEEDYEDDRKDPSSPDAQETEPVFSEM